MAAESEFSWMKIASFFGALVLIALTFVTVSSGISLITSGTVFNGVAVILSGMVCLANVVVVYKHYQKWSLERRTKK